MENNKQDVLKKKPNDSVNNIQSESYGILGELSQNETSNYCDNCRLCWVLSVYGQRFQENKVLIESDLFALVPALGAFIPGYTILISKKHWPSAALLNQIQLERLQIELDLIIKELRCSLKFDNWIIFEHGSTVDFGVKTCCIDHFHFHILPLEKLNLINEIETKLEIKPHKINYLTEISKVLTNINTNYILICEKDNEYFIFNEKIYSSQYLRQIICDHFGFGNDFRWQDFPRKAISLETLALFKAKQIVKKEIYFAHAIELMNEESIVEVIKTTRNIIESEISNVTLTSMYERLLEYNEEDFKSKKEFSEFLIETEVAYLLSCDIILADLSRPDWQYIGILMEIVYAKGAGIPIIVIKGDSSIEKRSWLLGHVSHIVKDLEGVIPLIRSIIE